MTFILNRSLHTRRKKNKVEERTSEIEAKRPSEAIVLRAKTHSTCQGIEERLLINQVVRSGVHPQMNHELEWACNSGLKKNKKTSI